MIYFIREIVSGRVKIGYTKDDGSLKKRLGRLQTGNPDELEVYGTIPGDMKVEKFLHHRFGRFRIRSNNEWFYWTDAVEHCIDKLLEKAANDENAG